MDFRSKTSDTFKLYLYFGFAIYVSVLGDYPLAVIYDTNPKENNEKQEIILKVMYVAAAFLLLYTEVETVIDHFIYGKAVVSLFLWDVMPRPFSKFIGGSNYETNLIFLISFLLILPMAVMLDKSKILAGGYRSSAVLAGVLLML